MMQSELKRKLESLVSYYFGGATVVWGQIKMVNPSVPQVTLNMGSVIKPYHPITRWVNGIPVNCFPVTTTMQVDLCTQGGSTGNEISVRSAYENTAINDLLCFVHFIDSAYVDDWSEINDISILAKEVLDLTELINDTSWDYRAMVELEIGFTQFAAGYTGINYEGGFPVPSETDGDENPCLRYRLFPLLQEEEHRSLRIALPVGSRK